MDTDTSKEIKDFLQHIELFNGLSASETENILLHLEIVSLEAREKIICQGSPVETLYVLWKGSVAGVYEDRYNLENRIFTLHSGDYFGHVPLLTGKTSDIDFYTLKKTTLLGLSLSFLNPFFLSHPSFLRKLFLDMTGKEVIFNKKLQEIKRKEGYLKGLLKTVEEEAPFLVGKTEGMKRLWDKLPKLATEQGPLLIKGEFGVGKELIAQILHSKSPGSNMPFIIIEATRISDDKWRERFWEDTPGDDIALKGKDVLQTGPEERSSFLGLAHGGTLLLKNVEALSPFLQKRLKAFLKSTQWPQTFSEQIYQTEQPIGHMADGRDKALENNIDFPRLKLLLTTHTDLESLVQQGKFDPELYSIINKRAITLPPLRERKLDILNLAYHFMAKYSTTHKQVTKLSSRARAQLLGYDYIRGNIQELEEIIKKGVDLTTTNTIRSEHLFLGPPAGKAHVWYNLLNIKPIGSMVRKGLYPGIFQGMVTILFFIIMYFCFFGPTDSTKNWGTILVWWMWWPFLCLGALWLGRTWCSFCAYASIGHLIQKKLNLSLKFPKILKDYDYIVGISIFLLVVWAEEVSGMRYFPPYTGLLLLSILGIEVVFSILFERDIWCRHICPMGNLIGVFAMCSLLEVRSNTDICANQCTTHECYHGNGTLQGCPMFQHLLYVDNNQTCKLCLRCVRVCPHKAVSLNIRPPGWEIWESNQVRPGMAFFVLTLMAVLFPVISPFSSILLNTISFLALPIVMISLIWSVSYISFHRVQGVSTNEGFWRTTYAYVPITLAAHTAYQIRYLPWIREINYYLLFKGQELVATASLVNLIQAGILLIGLLFSWYAIIKIARRNFTNQRAPHFFYWLGHCAIMIIYPLLIGFLLR